MRVYDIAGSPDRAVPIRLVSDFDQLRERWVKTPLDWVTAAHLSPTGDRVVLTARGQLFVVARRAGADWSKPRATARCATATARFMPDGKSLLALSDESGEVEFWRAPANGLGAVDAAHRPTAKVLRWDGLPSPDGKSIAHYDKDQQLWVLRPRDEEADQAGHPATAATSTTWLVARQPVARLHGARRQHADAHLPVRASPTGTHRAA